MMLDYYFDGRQQSRGSKFFLTWGSPKITAASTWTSQDGRYAYFFPYIVRIQPRVHRPPILPGVPPNRISITTCVTAPLDSRGFPISLTVYLRDDQQAQVVLQQQQASRLFLFHFDWEWELRKLLGIASFVVDYMHNRIALKAKQDQHPQALQLVVLSTSRFKIGRLQEDYRKTIESQRRATIRWQSSLSMYQWTRNENRK